MSNTTAKAAYAKCLEERSPNQWAALIKEHIEDEQLQGWVAGLVIHNYPKAMATEKEVWTSDLINIFDKYKSIKNENGSAELEPALASIGLPYFPSKGDDSPQARRAKNRETHTCLATKPEKRHEEAYRYARYHERENGEAG